MALAVKDCVVAFPWLFTVNANVKRYGNQDGISEVQLAVSRNLEEWARPFRLPVRVPGRRTACATSSLLFRFTSAFTNRASASLKSPRN